MIFDYFYNETLHDPHRADVKAMQRTAQLMGETYMFGVDRGQIESFLTQRGYRDIHNTDLEDIKKLYFTGPNSGRVMATGMAIVSARVNKT